LSLLPNIEEYEWWYSHFHAMVADGLFLECGFFYTTGGFKASTRYFRFNVLKVEKRWIDR